MKTLTKEHGLLTATGTFTDFDLEVTGTYSSWSQIGGIGSGSSVFVSKTYFDLAGMSMKEKTLFFEAAGTQTVLSPKAGNGASPGDNCLIYDIMSSSPLSDTDWASFTAFGNFAQPGAVLNWDETIFARSRLFGITVNEAGINHMLLLNE